MSNQRTAGRGLGIIGMLLVVVGIAGGVALFTVSRFRYADAVDSMVRAPVGCDTTLEFTKTGEFVVFVETEGQLDEVAGDCPAPSEWRRSADSPLPEVDVVIVDADGDAQDLRPIATVEYDTDDASGTSIGAIDVAEPGAMVARVTSPEVDDSRRADFVVTIGLNPDDQARPVLLAGIAVGAGGVAIGLILLIASAARSRRAARAAASAPAAPPTRAPAFTPAERPPLAPPASGFPPPTLPPPQPSAPPAVSPGPDDGLPRLPPRA